MNTENIQNFQNMLEALSIEQTECTEEQFLEKICDLLKEIIESVDDFEVLNKLSIENQHFYYYLIELLQDLNIQCLGSGYFAMAVRLPFLKNKVVKIGFKKEDSGAAYAAYCRRNKDFQNISKIHFIKRYDNFYMVVMDEYLKLNDVIYSDETSTKDKLFIELSYKIIDFAIMYNSRYTIEEIAVDLAQIQNSFDEMFLIKEILDENEDYFTLLRQQAKDIREFFKDIASFDIHEDNLMIKMVDDKPHVIITDPVSWVKK